MGVLLEGERRVLVAESLAAHLRWNASSKRDRGVRVPEVVKSDRRQVALGDDSLESLAIGLWVEGFAVLFAEHEIRIEVVVAPFISLDLLGLAVESQCFDCFAVDVERLGLGGSLAWRR